jgi:ABC exporter DevB family membrane fusion protein
MRKNVLIVFAVLIVTGLTVTFIWGGSFNSASKQNLPVRSTQDWIVAGAGRVEPSSEDIKLGAELSGKLKSVFVEEGDTVKRGQLLAELVNSDYQAQVESAQAEVAQKEAELRKVINGARREERREALSSVHEAEAVMNHARAEMLRYQKLFEAGVISREEAESYAKEYEVAKAKYQANLQRHTLIDEDAREEDVAMAHANLSAARARLDEARAILAKTFLRSPIDGRVLRKHHRTGESVSNGSTVPDPIFTLGDTRSLRIRVDIDEADISKIALNQKAYVTADAYGGKKFWGHVVRIGQELGRKNVRTDEPTERVDMKILETLIQLDDTTELPIGLRVNSFIMSQN